MTKVHRITCNCDRLATPPRVEITFSSLVPGTFNYYAASIDGRHYLPIIRDSVTLASRLQLGNIRPFGQDQVNVPFARTETGFSTPCIFHVPDAR